MVGLNCYIASPLESTANNTILYIFIKYVKHSTYILYGISTQCIPYTSSAAVSCGAPQTDNTTVVVGGVTAMVVTIAVMIIVVVAMLRFRCSLPARTPVQYVNIVLSSSSSSSVLSSSSVCVPLFRKTVSSLDVPTSTNEAYELTKQAGEGGRGGEGVVRGRGGEEGYKGVAHPPAQPVAAGEGVYEHIS